MIAAQEDTLAKRERHLSLSPPGGVAQRWWTSDEYDVQIYRVLNVHKPANPRNPSNPKTAQSLGSYTKLLHFSQFGSGMVGLSFGVYTFRNSSSGHWVSDLQCPACRCVVWGSGGLPRGSIVVPFWGSYIESYKAIPKRNYYGAFG